VTSWQWWEKYEPRNFPQIAPGAVFLSMYHGNIISKLISIFQGVGTDWSHTGIYIGDGKIAEATYPKGRVVSLRHYMGKRYTFEVYNVPGLTERERRHLAFVATVLAPRPYDTEKLFRHLFDNLIERITWNGRRGFRPLARLFKMDSDKDRRNVCSELTARPWDILTWLYRKGITSPAFRHDKGVVTRSIMDGIT
jgi:hypothetical protein